MAVLSILQYPDLRLRRKGYLVNNVQETKIQKTIEEMMATLLNNQNCAGLAATQLDLEEPPNIMVINQHHAESPSILCLLNTQILTKEGTTLEDEGCMSVYPQAISAKVTRAAAIKVKAVDQHGNQIEFEAKDFLARCIQHEYDHLQGILYIDHLPKLKRYRIDRKITKLLKVKKELHH